MLLLYASFYIFEALVTWGNVYSLRYPQLIAACHYIVSIYILIPRDWICLVITKHNELQCRVIIFDYQPIRFEQKSVYSRISNWNRGYYSCYWTKGLQPLGTRMHSTHLQFISRHNKVRLQFLHCLFRVLLFTCLVFTWYSTILWYTKSILLRATVQCLPFSTTEHSLYNVCAV